MPADPAAPIHPSQQLIETLWEDGQVRLSRCWLNGGPSTVLVVAPCHDHPPAAIVKRLEQEYALRSELEPHWAVRPLELRREGGRIRLVLADPGGLSLALSTGHPFEIGRFLRVAIQLTAALGEVHRKGIIHKDLKPAHVLVGGADQVSTTVANRRDL